MKPRYIPSAREEAPIKRRRGPSTTCGRPTPACTCEAGIGDTQARRGQPWKPENCVSPCASCHVAEMYLNAKTKPPARAHSESKQYTSATQTIRGNEADATADVPFWILHRTRVAIPVAVPKRQHPVQDPLWPPPAVVDLAVHRACSGEEESTSTADSSAVRWGQNPTKGR